jgi:ABC-type sugar transport system substrate-binding protein
MTKLGTGLRVATLALATALAATLAPAVAQAHRGGHANSGNGSPAVLQLPNGFQPEGKP